MQKDWHESIKQKFKRERKPLQMINNFVKVQQDKYGNGKTNGRPKRKSAVLQAERRVKDIVSSKIILDDTTNCFFQPLINLSDRQNANLSSLANLMKAELLKDNPDDNILHDIWRQSFNIRSLCVRELSIDEILERFPGYRIPEMVRTTGYKLLTILFLQKIVYVRK